MEYYLAIKMRNNWTSQSWDVLRDAGKGEVLGQETGYSEGPRGQTEPHNSRGRDPGWLQHRHWEAAPSYGSTGSVGRIQVPKKGKTLSKKFAIKYFNASGYVEGGWVGFGGSVM